VQVIDRRVRELSVECDLLPLSTPPSELGEYAAIIVSGGPQSVYAADAPAYDAGIFALGKPLLGICYGLQLLNHALGGTVEKKGKREDGAFSIALESDCALFDGLGTSTEVLLTHGDSVNTLPAGFRVVATSGELIAAIENADKKLYGVQFHPEVDLSVDGTAMLRNFLFGVCGLTGSYSAACRQDLAIEYIRETVGPTKKVLCLVSGGVDSSVCAALLHRAIGSDRLFCLHIDHGPPTQRRAPSNACDVAMAADAPWLLRRCRCAVAAAAPFWPPLRYARASHAHAASPPTYLLPPRPCVRLHAA
jgi:GMP synthase (glutamine-hydrolysing)